ncbi:hypothetical protein ACFL5M_02285 [Candidatus Neomarinimicrobiota bacterium]
MTRLNPPARVIANIDSAPQRMLRMDEILGANRLLRFAEAVSNLLVHIEPSAGGLARLASINGTGAIVCVFVMNAATEFESAWNMLRLANVPGTLRQSRVGSELVAAATLLALPGVYLGHLSADNPVAKARTKFPEATLADLMKPTLNDTARGAEYLPARLLATQVFRGFTMLLDDIDTVDQSEIEMLQRYRADVQHPASHGSRDLMAYHFEGFGKGVAQKAGAYIDASRHDTYQDTADSLIHLIGVMDSIALRVATHIRERC